MLLERVQESCKKKSKSKSKGTWGTEEKVYVVRRNVTSLLSNRRLEELIRLVCT